ncbi:PAS domain S-box protein [Kiritimatiellaeota bacterium B1221]|nr:PAS domain S-box protein [Kiritimatiellaeota bacterium B1221]
MLILCISMLLQLAAAALAFLKVRRLKDTLAWLMICIAFLLMALRRLITLVHAVQSDTEGINLSAEMVGLLISCLLLGGGWLMGRVFERLSIQQEELQRALDQRIEAEAQLKKNDGLLRQMGRIAHVGGWEFDPCTGKGSWTAEVAKIHGLDPKDETTMEKGLSFYQGKSRILIEQAVEEAIKFGKPYDLELEMVTAKGVRKWVRTIGRPKMKADEVVMVRGTFQDITEHKKAEERIRQVTKRQEELADIIEKSEQPVGVGYPDGRLGLCNAAFCTLTGYSMEELRGIDWNAVLTPPEWKDREQAALRGLSASGKPVRYRKEYLHKDGRRVPIEMLVHVCKDPAGAVQFYYAFITDITERLAAENALLLSEKRFEDIALSSGDWVWECDVEGRYIFAAGEVARITGYQPEEIVGMQVFELMDEEEAERFRPIFGEFALEKKPMFELETRMVSKSGRRVYLLTNAVPVFDDEGELLGYRGVDKDITEKKHRDEELRKYREHLEELVEVRAAELENLNRFSHTILETAPIGIVTFRSDGQCESVNMHMAKLVGESREQLLARKFHDFLGGGTSVLSRLAQSCLDSGESQRETVSLTTPGGKEVVIFVRFARFVVDEHPHLMLMANNVTERVRSEKALRASSLKLQASNRELEAFSYSVSHDLRSPLRSIDGFSQALLEDYGEVLDEEGEDYLQRIRAAAQRMGVLINDLLQLSRISRWQLENRTVDLGKLALQALSFLQVQNPERVVEIVIGKDLEVEGDPRLLRLVMENLMNNAWKFSQNMEIAKIEVGSARNDSLDRPHADLAGNRKIIYVKDNGVGFDMAYADKLFGAFQRLHTLSEFEGTGIGLATVIRAVQRQGGLVWADGRVGAGASFYLTLET